MTKQASEPNKGASSESDEETEEQVNLVQSVSLVSNDLDILAIARDIGKAAGGDVKEHSSKRQKLVVEERAFLWYSLAVQEDVDSYFDHREMRPEDFSWSADDVSKTHSIVGAARLFHEIRPFLPINPLDELILRLSSKLEKKATELIANVVKIL